VESIVWRALSSLFSAIPSPKLYLKNGSKAHNQEGVSLDREEKNEDIENSEQVHALALLNRLEAERAKSVLSGDLESIAALLSESLIYVHSTGGTDSKESYLLKLESGNVEYLSVEPRIEIGRQHDDELLIGVGTIKIQANVGNQLKQLNPRVMVVWKLNDGRWQLEAIQSSGN
jgi:hypothetical protein